jgi:hypothetical protein
MVAIVDSPEDDCNAVILIQMTAYSQQVDVNCHFRPIGADGAALTLTTLRNFVAVPSRIASGLPILSVSIPA